MTPFRCRCSGSSKGRKTQRNQEWFYENRERNKIFNFSFLFLVTKPLISPITAWKRTTERFVGFLMCSFGSRAKIRVQGIWKNLEKGIVLACARKPEQPSTEGPHNTPTLASTPGFAVQASESSSTSWFMVLALHSNFAPISPWCGN